MIARGVAMKVDCRVGRLAGMTAGVALVLSLSGCFGLPTSGGGPGSCDVTEPSVRWKILLPLVPSRLVDPEARPAVEGLLKVGSQTVIELDTMDGGFCGIDPGVTYHVSSPDVVRLSGALVTAIAPGHTQISATVRYAGQTSEATLFWCQPPPGGGPASPFPRAACTWIPMNGVRVVP
jgi:hypothetical protein